jgi:hypothetical protein
MVPAVNKLGQNLSGDDLQRVVIQGFAFDTLEIWRAAKKQFLLRPPYFHGTVSTNPGARALSH